MKGRVLPVGSMLDQPVFHRTEMDVVRVTAEIQFVADRVFPEPSFENGLLEAEDIERGYRSQQALERKLSDRFNLD